MRSFEKPLIELNLARIAGILYNPPHKVGKYSQIDCNHQRKSAGTDRNSGKGNMPMTNGPKAESNPNTMIK